MNLRDLHYLLAVADMGGFNRAADFCHVSQPTLSMQIKKLEEELGLKIFERSNKSVLLTEAGRRIVGYARTMIDHEKRIREVARSGRDPNAGDFSLGAIPTLASYIFPSYVAAIGRTFPGINLLLVEEKTETLLERLREGKLDAALLALPVHDASLTEKPLFDDPFLLAVNARHELAKRKTAKLEDLSGRPLLLLDEGHCLRDQALSVCHRHGAYEESGFRATSLETLRLMVEAHSNFITLMPAVAASNRDGLHYIPFSGAKPSRTIGLVFRKSSARGTLINEMAKLLTKKA